MKKVSKEELIGRGRKIYEILGIFSALFLIVLAVYFIYTKNFDATNDIYSGEVLRSFDEGWEMVRPNGERESITIPFSKSNVPADEHLSFVNILPKDISDRDVISTRIYKQNVYVYVDGQLRYAAIQETDGLFRKDVASRYIMINLCAEDAGKTIVINGFRTIDGSRRFANCFIGTKNGIIMKYMTDNLFAVSMSLFFLILGAAMAMAGLVLRISSRNKIQIDYIGWILFTVALWDATQSEYRDLFFADLKAVSLVPAICLILFCLAISRYFNKLQKGRYWYIYGCYDCALIVYAIISTVLQILRISDFMQGIYVVFAFIGLIATCMVLTICLDVRAGLAKEYFSICIGAAILTLCGLIQMIVFLSPAVADVSAPLLVGTAAFCICAFIHTIRDFLRMDTERKSAIAAADVRTRFLANMSHEIRTPINAILGMNEMILRESHEEEVQRYSADVDSAGKLLLVLVNDILDFSKLESGKMNLVKTEYALKPMILSAYSLIKKRAREKNLEVTLSVQEDMPSKLCGDEVRIKQITTNLITNAVKYTTDGSVGIKVFESTSADGGFILNIHVSDTGIGIREEDKDKLFEAFTRLDEKRNRNIEGTGLGLAITGQLVKLMNGTIAIDSVYGKGSTFKVAIPQEVISNEPLGDVKEDTIDGHSSRKASKDLFTAPDANILIIDDVAMNLRVATSLLKKTLIKIDTGSSGAECLKMVCQKHYDMIFLDHMMPGMDGIETFKQFKSLGEANLCKKVPVIMLTANAVAGAKEQFLEVGFDDYLSKPFDVTDLQQMLIKYLPKEYVNLL